MRYREPPMPSGPGFAFPRPGRALAIVMLALLALWVMFAVGINWGGGGDELFTLLIGDTPAMLRGQVWRLFTAPWMHLPSGRDAVSHIITTLLGLYFLGPSLEKKWGGLRFLGFLYGAALVGFLLQILAELALPASLAMRVQQPWFGSVGAVEAVAIAWAMSFRGRQVMLMFVLPVSSTVLVVFVVGMSVLRLFAGHNIPEGFVAPFGAMAFGWLVGGGESSPLRNAYLRWKLRRLAAQKSRDSAPRLRVIAGGRVDEEDAPPDSERGPWLN